MHGKHANPTQNHAPTGKLNSKNGSIDRFTFVDGGEPGRDADSATISIWAPGDNPDVDTPILGVHSSYRVTKTI